MPLLSFVSVGIVWLLTAGALWGQPFADPFRVSTLDGNNGFTIVSHEERFEIGRSVGAAGDVNGDGLADLIFGTSAVSINGFYSGAAWVVFGRESFPEQVAVGDLTGELGFSIPGVDHREFLGEAVSSAGDVNGDGFDDLIVSATGAGRETDGFGMAYVVMGRPTFPGEIDLRALDGETGFEVPGVFVDGHIGSDVASAGDLNGDGYDDLIVGGAHLETSYGDGVVHVVLGAPQFPPRVDLKRLNGSNGFTLFPRAWSDGSRAGENVSSAGDINGDGYDDLVVGAHLADQNGKNSGEAYVLFGGPSFPARIEAERLDGERGVIFEGDVANLYVGWDVSSAGDVNSDGYGDLLIGAYGSDLTADSAGAAYLVLGRPEFPPVVDLSALDGSEGQVFQGTGAGDHCGSSLSGLGDLNADGYDDFLIGASAADPLGWTSGEAYVVYGQAEFAQAFELADLDGSNGFAIPGEKTEWERRWPG